MVLAVDPNGSLLNVLVVSKSKTGQFFRILPVLRLPPGTSVAVDTRADLNLPEEFWWSFHGLFDWPEQIYCSQAHKESKHVDCKPFVCWLPIGPN
jgi:hypothetical protein